MEMVKKGVIYDRNYQIVVAIILLIAALALLFFVPISTDIGALISVYVLSGILFLLACVFLMEAYKKRVPEKQIVLRYLEFDPKQIVWVYSYVIETMPFGIRFMRMSTIYFYFKNGKYTTIRVKDAACDRLMKELEDKLPHASFGFTNEKEQLYKANPEMLYRDD